jgi:hypothetical protein
MPAPSRSPVFAVDTSRWPLVVLTYSGHASDEQWAGHLREIEDKVLGRRQRFVQVIDQTRGEAPDRVQQAILVRHQLNLEIQYRRFCLSEVYVAPPEMRKVMDTVFLRTKPQYPYVYVDALADGLRLAQARLDEAH